MAKTKTTKKPRSRKPRSRKPANLHGGRPWRPTFVAKNTAKAKIYPIRFSGEEFESLRREAKSQKLESVADLVRGLCAFGLARKAKVAK